MPELFSDAGINSQIGRGINRGSRGSNPSRVAVPGANSSVAQASVANTVGSALKIGEGINTVTQNVSDLLSDTGFGKMLRAVNLLPGAELLSQGLTSFTSKLGGGPQDWRVRLSLPATMKASPVIKPLLETNGLVFPYTPQIMMQHSAAYQSITPVHSNYPYFAYQNSQVNSITIMGDFLIENALEGQYWIGAMHYLRSVTKMAYGESSNQGNPPPVVKLNGYGDYVFNNIPVILTEFTCELGPQTDYMEVPVGSKSSWVPVRSNITVAAQPLYSRRATTKFSLDKFIQGNYIYDKSGFI